MIRAKRELGPILKNRLWGGLAVDESFNSFFFLCVATSRDSNGFSVYYVTASRVPCHAHEGRGWDPLAIACAYRLGDL